MRLWSIHPCYLDRLGLVALWREGLLAQKVLDGGTRGYKKHPQLARFQESNRPREALAFYLLEVWHEARRRGYNFDQEKLGVPGRDICLIISDGQLQFEIRWLKKKLKKRAPGELERLPGSGLIRPHPIFRVISGEMAPWEKGAGAR